jgi:hypothetical protein
VVGGLVQFIRVEKVQLRSRLVWWTVVLFNLEDWKKRSFKVDWFGGQWCWSIQKNGKSAGAK